MKKSQRADKILTILIILSIGISFSLFSIFFLLPHMIEMNRIHIPIPVNNTINQCGYTEKNVVINLDGSIITSRMFSYPYIGVKINANDYFFLEKQIAMWPYNGTMFGFNQSKYYSLILKEFRKTKNEYNMDDDQYVQFIVNYVQSMPYYEEPSNSNNGFPIVTFVDGCGNCEDKSLLLTALLTQENFNVSFVTIPPYNNETSGHMMVGIASNCATIRKDGYAMIETTAENSAIGNYPFFLNMSGVIVQKVGNGTKTFETFKETLIYPNQSQYEIIREGPRIISITPILQ